MTPNQVEELLRRLASQSPPQSDLGDARATLIRSKLAALAGAESRSPRFAIGSRGRWLLSAAASLILATFWYAAPRAPHGTRLAFDVAIGPSADELFRVQRSAPASRAIERVFVGVRTERAAFIRLLAHEHVGSIESLALDRQGSTTLPLLAGAVVVFGGFAVEQVDADRVSRLTHVVVLCSADRISDDRLREALSAMEAEQRGANPGAVQGWAERLGNRLGASVQVRAVAGFEPGVP